MNKIYMAVKKFENGAEACSYVQGPEADAARAMGYTLTEMVPATTTLAAAQAENKRLREALSARYRLSIAQELVICNAVRVAYVQGYRDSDSKEKIRGSQIENTMGYQCVREINALSDAAASHDIDAALSTPADTSELDRLVADAGRYRLLRRGQRWSVINGIGDTLRCDQLDAAIDAARAEVKS